MFAPRYFADRYFGTYFGPSDGVPVHPSHDRPPPFRGNPLSVFNEIQRGRIINRLVLIQLGLWRDEFATFMETLPQDGLITWEGRQQQFDGIVSELWEPLEQEWFNRLFEGGGRPPEMAAAPNPFVEEQRTRETDFLAAWSSFQASNYGVANDVRQQ